ncbi:NAD(P)/FAD-dependent oxidoreductase [Isoptericola sediminis]|uniref:NAD(P)/FAD-dependent oxidoreductase n=1 Tax=Isoptericola sediminis TaxID=2733572 RepID=UPI001FE24800|nr:FAD-dependent oxidoreductase [Isoptericola sediminis]
MQHIVVVGAGYAGVAAANHLTAEAPTPVRVTVVNPREEFVERIRLHQLVAGTGSAVRPLRPLLRPGVDLRLDTVTRVGADGVALAGGGDLAADRIVYAVGSGAGPAMPGALPVRHLDGAVALRHRVDGASAGTPVTVVGGGLTGIEAASELAEAHPHLRVRLVAGALAAGLSPAARDAVRRGLEALGVEVREGEHVDAPGDGITVDATSFAVPGLARDSGLAVDDAGRLLVDDALRGVDVPTVVAAGDAASTPLRMSCQTAIPLGIAAADTVLAELRGEQPRPVSVGLTMTCVSLGRRRGVVQPTDRLDVPRGPVLRGRAAALVKEQVCRATVRFVRRPARAVTRAGDGPLLPATVPA